MPRVADGLLSKLLARDNEFVMLLRYQNVQSVGRRCMPAGGILRSCSRSHDLPPARASAHSRRLHRYSTAVSCSSKTNYGYPYKTDHEEGNAVVAIYSSCITTLLLNVEHIYGPND